MGITVIMTTYEDGKGFRCDYARRVAESLLSNLKAPTSMTLHIADDGSVTTDYINDIRKRAEFVWGNSGYTNAERHGIGASLNLALKAAEGDVWIYNTDDWVLTHEFDLVRALKLINNGYDLVRIGPVHPNLACKTMFNTKTGWWLDIDASNGGFAFGTRPFLATKAFYEKIGPFDENCSAYDMERIYSDRVSKSDVRIAALWLHGPWVHVGNYAVGHIDPK